MDYGITLIPLLWTVFTQDVWGGWSSVGCEQMFPFSALLYLSAIRFYPIQKSSSAAPCFFFCAIEDSLHSSVWQVDGQAQKTTSGQNEYYHPLLPKWLLLHDTMFLTSLHISKTQRIQLTPSIQNSLTPVVSCKKQKIKCMILKTGCRGIIRDWSVWECGETWPCCFYVELANTGVWPWLLPVLYYWMGSES